MRPKSLIPFKERRRLANQKYNHSKKGIEANKKWAIRNRKKINEYARQRYKTHKKTILAQHIAHHKRFKEHYYAYKRKWDKTLRGKLNQIIGRIRRRCNSKNAHNFKYYGGRGIKCELTLTDLDFLWKRDYAFRLKRPSIDRINNDGPYSRSNCQFIEHSANIAKRNRKKSLAL